MAVRRIRIWGPWLAVLVGLALLSGFAWALSRDAPNLESRSKFHNAVSLKLSNNVSVEQIRQDIERLGAVASTEIDANTGRLTAFPASGQLPLPAISELANQRGWELAELHLESGRLDEVFRTITAGAQA